MVALYDFKVIQNQLVSFFLGSPHFRLSQQLSAIVLNYNHKKLWS